GAQNRFTNGFTWRSREDLNIDTRTATEYGVVRTYFDATFTWTSDSYGQGATAGGTVYAPLGSGTTIVGAPGNATGGGVAGGALGVYYAFIQFAGFTMGKAVSQFSAPWSAYPGNTTFDGLVGGGGTVTGVNQFTYTAEFGNGVSGSIGVQDPSAYYQAGVNNIVAGSGYGISDYAGTDIPDVVAMLRVDQAWGLFQASVAAHENNAAYYGAAETTGGPGNRWGYAGQLALSIKNIPTGAGDSINMQAVYTNGATRYNIQDLAAGAGAATIFSGFGVGSVGIGFAPDSVFGPGGSQQLITTWGGRGAFNHNWNANWSSSIFGAYAAVSYTGAAKALICAGQGVAGFAAGLTTCNPDYNIGQIGANLRWTPVKNLTFTAEGVYTMLDQNYVGTLASGGANGKPAGAYTAKDQDTWTVMLRAQRVW
ncbi:MAG: porin, partial [Proteobacteria bacterium]|nr:porin [Pseudomonadota bacterium]